MEDPKPTFTWSKAITVLGIVMVAAATFLLARCMSIPEKVAEGTFREARQTAREIGAALKSVAEGFKSGNAETTFRSYATTLSPHQRLQFSTLKQQERFTRKEEARIFWEQIPLPDVVIEVDFPVEYTYFVDFNGKWAFNVSSNVIDVTAPKIQWNSPAVDISRLNFTTVKDSKIRDTETVKNNIQRELPLHLRQRAKENVNLVRETGRKQIQEFVGNWVARSFGDATNYTVRVRFEDEPAGKAESFPIIQRDF